MELREEIRNHIARSGGSKDWGVIVRFYLDLHHGVRSGGRRKPDIADCVRQFVGGFNQSVLLFDLIDTGHGAEVSLFKMKGEQFSCMLNDILTDMIAEAFNLFIDNVQCKHIYFGCALKPESVSILSEYQFNPIIADSITLLQSSPPEPATYKPPFDIVQFRKIFKSSEDGLGDGQTGWDSIQERGQANVSPAMSISNDFSGNQDAALEGWARSAHDQAKSGLTTPTPRHDPRFSRPHAYAREPIGSWHANSKTIWLNINNERVDPELGKIDQGAYDQLKTRAQNTTLCGWYHLTGHCSSSVCEYAHGPRLPPALADALRQRVRAWTPCRNGSACRQVNCIYGHMCPEADCTKGHACRYAKLHGKDRTAVRPWEGRKVRNDEYPTQPRRLVEPSVKDSTASPPKGHKELGAHFDVASKDLTGTDRDTEFITINQPSRGGQGPLFDHYSHTAEAHACENLFDEPENQEPDQGSGKTEEEDEVPLPKYEHIRMFQKRGSNNP